MNSFKLFLLESENEYKKETEYTLRRLPKSHQNLVKGFSFEFQLGNTLKHDKQHVGMVDPKRKKIIIAAPWRYPREWTLLHEIAHMVWGKFVTSELQKKWKKITSNTKIKNSDKQGLEETFAMAYACFYSQNKITKFDHPAWNNFIKELPS